MDKARSRSLDLAPPRRRVGTAPAVALWRPEIVLATSVVVRSSRSSVALAEPPARPEALHSHLDTARSLLASLAEARQTLLAAAADAQGRAAQAGSTRDRVSATIAAYRIEAKLDDVLTGTLQQVSALMEERGL
jgi:hypothetical protein